MPKPKPEPEGKFMAFRASPELASAMQQLHARDGIPISEQLRRAMHEWLKKQGISGRAKKKEKR